MAADLARSSDDISVTTEALRPPSLTPTFDARFAHFIDLPAGKELAECLNQPSDDGALDPADSSGFVLSTHPLEEYAVPTQVPRTIPPEEVQDFRKKALQALIPNSVIVCTVRAKRTDGLGVELNRVCDRPAKMLRFIDKLKVNGWIRATELSERYVSNLADLLDDFRVGDKLKAAVASVQVEEEKVTLTLKKSSVDIPGHHQYHRLGLCDSSEATEVEYPHRSYNEDLKSDPTFANPISVLRMSAALGCNGPELVLDDLTYPGGNYYALREQQNKDWAVETVRLGVSLAKNQDYKGALKWYNIALHVNPGNVDARVARGACYANMNRLQDASADLKKVLAIDPNNANAQIYLEKVKEKMAKALPSPSELARAAARPAQASTQPSPSQPKYSLFVSAAPGGLAPDKLKQLLKEDEQRHRDKKRKRDKKSKHKSKHKRRSRSRSRSRSPSLRDGSKELSRSRSRSKSPSKSKSKHRHKRQKKSSPVSSHSEAMDDENTHHTRHDTRD